MLHFIIQLCVCDMVSLLVAAIELRYMQQLRWTFPAHTCSLYLGLESVCSTATIYMLVALNLHAISTFNLARKTIRREDGQQEPKESQYTSLAQIPPTDNDDYEVTIDDATAALEQPRSLTIDYSQPKKRVQVLFPILFVWFLTASVSTPLFVLGSVLPNERKPLVCGIVNLDSDNNRLMQSLFVSVRIAIPALCLMLTFASVTWKLVRSRRLIRPCGLDEDVRRVLILAAVLTVTFLLFSAQRMVGSSLYEVWTQTPFMLPKYPALDRGMAILLVMLHWSVSALRPFAYLLAPSVRSEVGVTMGCGKRRKRRDNAIERT